jgi:hypothetical protein
VMGFSWLKAHDAWTRFQIVSQLKDQQIALRDKQASADSQTIEQLKKQAQTPQQIVREIPQVISLPVPIRTEEAESRTQEAGKAPGHAFSPLSSSPSTSPGQALPEAPAPQSSIVIPPEDVKPLFDRLADCKAMETQISACRQNYLDMKKERDLAAKARTGSWWQRAKQVGIGIAIGSLVGYAAHR